MSAIKICGISTLNTLDAAIDSRADFVGLVFFPPSPRHVDSYAAAALAARAGPRIGRVGLFVDADDGLIAESIKAGRLDVLQLHGEEPPERIARVKQQFGLPVWKAVPVSGAKDVERAAAYTSAADLILFDAKTPKDAALPGGMGLSFDWSLLAQWRGRPGWGLAGGLNPGNVVNAMEQTAAPLLDTSSGVETSPGQKSPELIKSFCEAARGA